MVSPISFLRDACTVALFRNCLETQALTRFEAECGFLCFEGISRELEPRPGLEPGTYGLRNRRSTN